MQLGRGAPQDQEGTRPGKGEPEITVSRKSRGLGLLGLQLEGSSSPLTLAFPAPRGSPGTSASLGWPDTRKRNLDRAIVLTR